MATTPPPTSLALNESTAHDLMNYYMNEGWSCVRCSAHAHTQKKEDGWEKGRKEGRGSTA
jgi:hypothetical protein